MIRAYFDDSGTHSSSGVVVVAGIIGTEPEIDTLDALWAEHLAAPLCGMKAPLRRFHMVECEQSKGEFSGWKRTETDYFCHQLREAIIKSRVSGYGFACVREEWDRLIQGEYRTVFGDPEGWAVRACMNSAINWASNSTFDPQMAFVFDDRPDREREIRAVFDIFKRLPRSPELVGISFLNSHKVRPLQAADMVAWEFYSHAERILRHGNKHPARKQVLHLLKNMNLYAQIATKEKIQEMKARILERERNELNIREIFDEVRALYAASAEQSS